MSNPNEPITIPRSDVEIVLGTLVEARERLFALPDNGGRRPRVAWADERELHDLEEAIWMLRKPLNISPSVIAERVRKTALREPS